MKRILAAAAVSGLCSLAAPAWAQANGGGNPCLMDVNLHANGLIFGAGSDIPVKDNDCWKLQRAQFAGLMAVNAHDAELAKAYAVASKQLLCSIDDVRAVATALCVTPTAPQAAETVSPVPQPSAVAPPVVAALTTPVPVAMGKDSVPNITTHPSSAPQQVAMDSSEPPSVIATPCTPPPGVPASMWSGCWAR